ncbi:AfsR/SARP family transcriptional regulator [Kitasatospora sp. NPDC004272]
MGFRSRRGQWASGSAAARSAIDVEHSRGDRAVARFLFLGPLEICAAQGPVGVGGGRQRSLLLLLLVNEGRLVTKEQIMAEIWPEGAPRQADNALHALVARLRKALDSWYGPGFAADHLVTGRPGYGLYLDPDESDAAEFSRLSAQARSWAPDRPDHALRLLEQALALWRGPALGDGATGPLLAAAAARLDEQRLAAVEERLRLEEALGHHAPATCELQQLVALHPLHEGLARHLMTALYRSGRQAEALAEYHRIRSALRNELGLDPSPALRAFMAAILRHEMPVGAEEAGPLHGRPRTSARALVGR